MSFLSGLHKTQDGVFTTHDIKIEIINYQNINNGPVYQSGSYSFAFKIIYKVDRQPTESVVSKIPVFKSKRPLTFF